MIELELMRELRLVAPSAAGRPRHLAAASGLVVTAAHCYVVADDELHLGVFPRASALPGTLCRLLPGELPDEAAARKRAKSDFEALVWLPPLAEFRQGALFALGSGSKKRRRDAVLAAPTTDGGELAHTRVVDLEQVFRRLADEVDDLNIEGACVRRDEFILVHRGNKSGGVNALFHFALADWLKALRRDAIGGIAPRVVRHYDLGIVSGDGDVGEVPLCFTDTCVLNDGRIVFSAVAENTADSYHDGPCLGAALGVIDHEGRLAHCEGLAEPYKIEGIAAQAVGSDIEFLAVTDADDANRAAQLLRGTLDS